MNGSRLIPAPRYALQSPVLADLGWAMLTGQKRSFRTHAIRLLATVRPPARIIGETNIPHRGPGIILVNHYSRPGFWAVWIAIAISAVVPEPIYWTMTNALRFPHKKLGEQRRKLSHILLTRIAKVYEFNSMPPMPPAPGEEMQRAEAVKRLVTYSRGHPAALIGLAAEGYDRPGGVIDLPPTGAGRLLLLLSEGEKPIYPVGIFEEGGQLTVSFGAPVCLDEQGGSDRFECDQAARENVTRAVARLLPERLRGGW